ncbi:MAG: glycoside hydrolase family 15 protein [Candidatus Latescibacteria bacterium]|nr:glycoside hydrolase family 15 protein [Candidatus Latescibacterota bacterium]
MSATPARNLDLGMIGNCSVSALIDARGRFVWSCLPRFDGDPVFCALLCQSDEGRGVFEIEVLNMVRSEQRYLRNTAILVTTLHDGNRGAVEITDFSPRFRQHGRMFYPAMFIRRVRRVGGSPVVRVRLDPRYGYGHETPTRTFGSNHIRYITPEFILRLTTDVSVTAVLEQTSFVLDRDATFILGPDETVTESVGEVGNRFFEETKLYWLHWVRFLGIPFEWQEAVIRAAITLKLSAYDDTGAIVAAMTTSIPEFPNSGRNWDYRYCWLRDSYFVISALNRLSATSTMERYLGYIVNIAATTPEWRMQPVYGITGRTALEETLVEHLPGFQGMGPVRVGNAAFAQRQNDVYGSAVLSATHVFFDERLALPGNATLFNRLEPLGEAAVRAHDQPDDGIWEFRSNAKVHTFSAVMCWVACDRLARIATRLGLHERAGYWRGRADGIRGVIETRAWNAKLGSFVESFEGKDLDGSLLLLHEVDFLSADDPRFAGTVAAVEKRLRKGDFVYRYVGPDDFGEPQSAFVVCTFWYIDALAALGRKDEARALFENLLAGRNHLGLLSEDIDPQTKQLWGNFPQTYSMVGLINSAVRLSKSWEEAF